MAYKHVSFMAIEGGHLVAGTNSGDTAGAVNYVEKLNFRRESDGEVRREGWEKFKLGSEVLSSLTSPFDSTVGDYYPVRLLYQFFSEEKQVVVAAAGDKLYRLHNDIDAFGAYSDNNWQVIAEGLQSMDIAPSTGVPVANRWEVLSIDGNCIFNNGVDLPLYYREDWPCAFPMYSLRERGILRCGTIGEFDGRLWIADVEYIKDDYFGELMRSLKPYGLPEELLNQPGGVLLADKKYRVPHTIEFSAWQLVGDDVETQRACPHLFGQVYGSTPNAEGKLICDGIIDTIEVTAGGSGYSTPPVVTITDAKAAAIHPDYNPQFDPNHADYAGVFAAATATATIAGGEASANLDLAITSTFNANNSANLDRLWVTMGLAPVAGNTPATDSFNLLFELDCSVSGAGDLPTGDPTYETATGNFYYIVPWKTAAGDIRTHAQFISAFVTLMDRFDVGSYGPINHVASQVGGETGTVLEVRAKEAALTTWPTSGPQNDVYGVMISSHKSAYPYTQTNAAVVQGLVESHVTGITVTAAGKGYRLPEITMTGGATAVANITSTLRALELPYQISDKGDLNPYFTGTLDWGTVTDVTAQSEPNAVKPGDHVRLADEGATDATIGTGDSAIHRTGSGATAKTTILMTPDAAEGTNTDGEPAAMILLKEPDEFGAADVSREAHDALAFPEDGSRILKMVKLADKLLVYRQTGYIAISRGNAQDAFTWEERYRGERVADFRNTVISLNEQRQMFVGYNGAYFVTPSSVEPEPMTTFMNGPEFWRNVTEDQTEYIFAIENGLTQEAMIVAPIAQREDLSYDWGIISFDMIFGTLSTMDSAFTAACTVFPSGQINSRWFLLATHIVADWWDSALVFLDSELQVPGTSLGAHIMRYGYGPSDGSAPYRIFARDGGDFTSRLRFGKTDFNDRFSEKSLRSYLIHLSDANETDELLDQATATVNIASFSAAATVKTDEVTEVMSDFGAINMIPLFARGNYYQDTVEITGSGIGFKFLGRTFEVSGVKTRHVSEAVQVVEVV